MLSPVNILRIREFESSVLDQMPEEKRDFLIACVVSLETIAPGDAGLEVDILYQAICKLRDAWREHEND